ncbi:RES family NAD+ phosphorylase [Gluconobacter wancherniae]|uniref:RES family NAD+ phosphorylase n=1 Tax=Gluconobacter wancherniae TaxID=1307955 RepID=UPI0030B33174
MLDSLPEQSSLRESDLWVCSSCIGDTFLKEKINEIGKIQKCFFCNTTDHSITIDELADDAVHAFERCAHPCNSPADKEAGVSPEIAVSQLLKSDKRIGEVAFRVLRQKYADYYIKELKWDVFDPSCLYKIAFTFVNMRSAYWDMACCSLKSKSRFFNEEVKKNLESIFKNIPPSALKTVRCDSDYRFFRARIANNEQHVCEILQRPIEQFGPPPLGNIFGGRMNPVGIPVLYTALEEDTALAEVRPHLDATVVIASLTPLRDVTLLDLTALGDYEIDESPFNPHMTEELCRLSFLQEFSKILSRPVNPAIDSIEYLPTQCVADYIANSFKPKVDGFICYSAMQQGGKNVIFFQDSLTIIGDDQPAISNVEFEDAKPWNPEDIDTYIVHYGPEIEQRQLYKEPVLRLINRDITIKKITGISYSYDNNAINWKDYIKP